MSDDRETPGMDELEELDRTAGRPSNVVPLYRPNWKEPTRPPGTATQVAGRAVGALWGVLAGVSHAILFGLGTVVLLFVTALAAVAAGALALFDAATARREDGEDGEDGG